MIEIFVQDKHLGLVEIVQRELEGEIRTDRWCESSISAVPAIHKTSFSYLSVAFITFSDVINLCPKYLKNTTNLTEI